MAVSTAYSPVVHVGDGATTAISITWPFFLSSHLTVVEIASSGAETSKALTTDFTVSGGTDSNGLPATGTLTANSAPASGVSWRIERVTPRTQSSVWPSGNAFRAKTLEAALDWGTLVLQEAEYNSTNHLTHRGAWSATTVYKVGNLVENDGASYFCILGHTAAAADEPGVGVNESTYWELAAAAGTNGTNGADGADGADGATGPAGPAGAGSGDMLKSENLSGLADNATARTNLGLGTAATSASGDFAAASHNHAASAITSGALAHERGGLEADVSAYDGLVRITGGATSAVANATQVEMEAGTETALRGMSPERIKQAIDALATGGGPSKGTNSVIRTNAKNIIEDITLSDHSTTFTVDTGAETLDVGTDDGYANEDRVYLTTTGTLPAGLSTATEYHVISVAAATLQLAATNGGSAINITDTGTGTHTIYQPVNGGSWGPITVETGHSVTVPTGSTWTVV